MARFKQERMTYQDTVKAQDDLRDFLDFKMKYPFVTKKERKTLTRLLADAFLSQAVESGIRPRMRIGNKTCIMASNVHTFGLKLVDMDVDREHFTRVDGVQVEARELWRVLKEYCLMLFPMALSEAIHMSREKEKKGGRSGYEFKTPE